MDMNKFMLKTTIENDKWEFECFKGDPSQHPQKGVGSGDWTPDLFGGDTSTVTYFDSFESTRERKEFIGMGLLFSQVDPKAKKVTVKGDNTILI